MTSWEQKIIDEFIKHYFDSISESYDIDSDDTRTLRLKTSTIFSNFDKAHHEEKESYIEAAELLEKKGIAKLNWEKHGKGERLKTLSCDNLEGLFKEAGRPFPQTEAKEICEFAKDISNDIIEKYSTNNASQSTQIDNVLDFLEYINYNFTPRYIAQGINKKIINDLVILLEYICKYNQKERLTTRALSILLYNDSKYLENLISVCKPLIAKANELYMAPDLSFLERSYPETLIAGNIGITFINEPQRLINYNQYIFGLPLETIECIKKISVLESLDEKRVLTVENKETFYSLASVKKRHLSETESSFDCYIYTGGYPNSAVVTLIKHLVINGFTFYHAGDLDPDGILILQNIQEITQSFGAKENVIPFKMDTDTFKKYKPYGRKLEKTVLNQLKKIKEETKTLPGIAELIQHIERTGLGVEQEIIDYRSAAERLP